ncbi:hypothetical protein SM124_09485 [Bacillus sp. 31A1R]|uniref:Flagellar protein FliT n=1 Tax=Robertmurraya mangrovi TaxID=3098077 RepID=A0ABU5IXT0_9BACI|nr:hypothetical protein [Bacillus sp. 31A1R]MDZ5471979.1 hypothetical protein [Bacillus sp. 31A1R]
MNELVSFIQKTKELEAHLNKAFPIEGRETYIEEVFKLLEERQVILNQLPDLSKVLEERVKEDLIQLESRISTLLAEKMTFVKDDLRILQQRKNTNNQYENPYGNISADGMFLDKKK